MARTTFENIAKAIRNSDSAQISCLILNPKSIITNYSDVPLSQLLQEIEQVFPQKWQKPIIYLTKVHLSDDSEPQREDKFTLANEFTKCMVQIAYKEDGWIVAPLCASCLLLKRQAIMKGLATHLETCSRTLNSALKVTQADKLPDNGTIPANSRRHGYYDIANMLMSIYFRVRAFSLANGLVNSTNTQLATLIPLKDVPVKKRVTWLYYNGVLKFIDQKYAIAQDFFTQAFKLCGAHSNQQLILFYLIPLKLLLDNKFPSAHFPWHNYPALAEMYQPFIRAIKTGNIRAYKDGLEQNRNFLVEKHLYLALLKLTNLVRVHLVNKVWIIRDRVDKLDLNDFVLAFKLAGQLDATLSEKLAMESTQLTLANMIYNGDLLGVIYAQLEKLVIKKSGAFPKIQARSV